MTEREFQNALVAELQGLGEEPSTAQVLDAIKRLQAAGAPSGASFEGLVFMWSLAKARESGTVPAP
jgi:hypothetical protein